MALHTRLTQEIREGPTGSKVGAFFDLDQTLLAGFSATSFMRERLVSGRVSPRELADAFYATLSFGLGRTGFSGLMSATTAAYRGLAESGLEAAVEQAVGVLNADYPRQTEALGRYDEAHQAPWGLVGQPDMAYLAGLDQVGEHAQGLFNGGTARVVGIVLVAELSVFHRPAL